MKQATRVPWVGPFLYEERIRQSKTAEEVAARAGIHPSNLRRREKGGAAISADDLPAMLAAYEIPPARFAAKLKEMS